MKQIPVNNLPLGDHELKVISLGHFTPYDFQKPHRHSYFEFFIFEKGGGTHFIDFVEHPINDRSVHIVFPQQIHMVKRNENSAGSIVICSVNFMNLIGRFFFPQLVQNNYQSPCLDFKKQEFENIVSIIKNISEELQSGTMLSYNLVQNYTSIFLTYCIRNRAIMLAEEIQNPHYNQQNWTLYKDFNELADKHFLEKAGVAFYAAKLACTPKVLNGSIKKVTGKTAVELLQERTIIEAKRLLLNGNESIKEIAFKLNFKDSSYFSRFFVKNEGQTPKEFKLLWVEKYHS